jgi:hypothetical protein
VSHASFVVRTQKPISLLALRYRIETLARANEKLLTKEYLHLQVRAAAIHMEFGHCCCAMRVYEAVRMSACRAAQQTHEPPRDTRCSPCKPCRTTPRFTLGRKFLQRCTQHTPHTSKRRAADGSDVFSAGTSARLRLNPREIALCRCCRCA